MSATLAIVTATTNPGRAAACIDSWFRHADVEPLLIVVQNGGASSAQPYLGTVPAFRQGVDQALEQCPSAAVIACLHDDFEIAEDGWDQKVLRYFGRLPALGLAGFGGAKGLGALDLYQQEYDPMALARVGFRSDLVDAEAHGLRSLLAEKVACLDGFSQVGRREFWEGYLGPSVRVEIDPPTVVVHTARSERPWTALEALGLIHHFYDGALGCLAKRHGWETWYLPLRGRHHGGQTAVGDPGYQAWAQQYGGDQGLWQAAHRIGYEAFKDVLPLRV